jgi:hypothetical protein
VILMPWFVSQLVDRPSDVPIRQPHPTTPTPTNYDQMRIPHDLTIINVVILHTGKDHSEMRDWHIEY